MQFIFHSPINSLSLGNVGYNLLREAYRAGHEVGWFPVGQTDVSAFKQDKDFISWLENAANNRYAFLKRGMPAIVNWHISDTERQYSDKQILLTYKETSESTPIEEAIVENQYKTLFCGGHSGSSFEKVGLKNVGSFDLGFDEEIFPTGKTYFTDRINWGLVGKFEKRKNTEGIIRAWVKKYGNNKDHSLTCLIDNPFYSPEDNAKIKHLILEGKRVWNLNFIPRLKTNSEVNELTNAIDIDLSGASFSESWGLPAFNSTCLGKWSLVNNYGGHKAWATKTNSVLIEPTEEQECYDDAFFKKGQPFNQGNYSNYSEDILVDGMERAEKKAAQKNTNGITLGKEMTYGKSLEKILSEF